MEPHPHKSTTCEYCFPEAPDCAAAEEFIEYKRCRKCGRPLIARRMGWRHPKEPGSN